MLPTIDKINTTSQNAPIAPKIHSGSGISGSTAWHGAFRFRFYLKSSKPEGGEQPDNDIREMEFKKNQYGPKSESLVLRYQRGLFLPEGGACNLDQAARKAKAEEVFMDLLQQFSNHSRNVSEKATANNYAPTAFAKEDEAKKHRLKKAEFEQTMRDLFKANRITLEQYDKPSLHRYRLVTC